MDFFTTKLFSFFLVKIKQEFAHEKGRENTVSLLSKVSP